MTTCCPPPLLLSPPHRVDLQGRVLSIQARAPPARTYLRDPLTGTVYVRQAPGALVLRRGLCLGSDIDARGLSATLEDGLLAGG